MQCGAQQLSAGSTSLVSTVVSPRCRGLAFTESLVDVVDAGPSLVDDGSGRHRRGCVRKGSRL